VGVSLYSVAIFVRNLDRAVEFYQDTLGLALGAKGSFGAEFEAQGIRIGVHPANHEAAQAMVGRETGLTFHVDGLLHVCGDLHAKGVTFRQEPTQMSFGIMAMIEDPDGNVMALWQPPEEESKDP
jgi:predicted enzyme related to lactoylglutathione lyase